MNLIICVDDRNGMLFGGRRQSRDSAVCKKCTELAENEKIWMNAYSGKLFREYSKDIIIDEEFLDKADSEDYCFIENSDYMPYVDNAQKIILFKWNRHYPADTFFSVDLNDGNWTKNKTEMISGSSHEKITIEEYVR